VRYLRLILLALDPVYLMKQLSLRPYKYQLSFLKDTSSRIVVKAGRQTGKSTAVALLTIQFAIMPNKTILIISPSLRQSSELLRKIRRFVSRLDIPVCKDTSSELELCNGSRILSLPASEYTIRGYSAHMVIVDEAAFVPDTLYETITPMLAATNGRLILVSTPFGKKGYFYRAWLDDGFSHHEFSVNDCPHISKEFLDEERNRMSELAFRQEYLAEFVEHENCVFPYSLVMGAVVDADDREMGSYANEQSFYCGVDLAKHVDYTVFVVVKEIHGVLEVVEIETYQKIPYPLISERLKKLHSKFNFRRIVIDATGVGEAVVDMLKWDSHLPIEPFVFTTRSKLELIEMLRVALENGELKLIRNQRLLTELTMFGVEEHDDHVIALALAVWASHKIKKPKAFVFGGRI
jgi:hypothetical protein